MAATSSEEFNYWLAFMELETLDLDGYYQSGILASLIVAALSSKSKVTAEDFIPRLRDVPKGMSPEQAKSVLKGLFGGKKRR